MSRPHIFLDVDGVLNCIETWSLNDGQQGTFRICPERVARMAAVMDDVNAVVVMSSTWRKFHDHMDYLRLKAPAIMARLHEDWRTPSRHETYKGRWIVGRLRGDEIADWLSFHPDVTNWAIVDDDSDMLKSQLPRFVHTSWEKGFEDIHAQKLKTILTGEVKC